MAGITSATRMRVCVCVSPAATDGPIASTTKRPASSKSGVVAAAAGGGGGGLRRQVERSVFEEWLIGEHILLGDVASWCVSYI